MSVSRTILNGEPPILTEVTVTIRQRSGGVYNCTVSNARVEDGTLSYMNETHTIIPGITASPDYAITTVNGKSCEAYGLAICVGAVLFKFTVTGTPTNVTITDTNSTTVLVSWTASTTPEAGYEVFYETADGERHSVGNTTDTNLTLSSGLRGNVCSIFVKAYRENYIEEGSAGSLGAFSEVFLLPSARSNATCIGKFEFLSVIFACDCSKPLQWIGVCVLYLLVSALPALHATVSPLLAVAVFEMTSLLVAFLKPLLSPASLLSIATLLLPVPLLSPASPLLSPASPLLSPVPALSPAVILWIRLSAALLLSSSLPPVFVGHQLVLIPVSTDINN